MNEKTPLQAGTWTLNSNGTIGTLELGASSAGIVNGTIRLPAVSGDISGFWDEDSQKLTFAIVIPAPVPRPPAVPQPDLTREIMQVYVGFMFEDQVRLTAVSGGTVYTLAGVSEDFGLGGTAQQRSFGWYAQIGVE